MGMKKIEEICLHYKNYCYNLQSKNETDPVAQLDRVPASDAVGHEFDSHRDRQFLKHNARVAELVDALASGVSAARCEGSSPSFRTI